uniref:Aspartate/glutamate/uridylate kinase domain-containing protein n=1 Tax=Chromera velia CCMP2878 TaxID=1169474 RepID=A0A0G4FUA6_9ALVE|eukprot:Cvel_18643.t1-p1 / transcript=Cvel_18643.t1 / gene=Cvel_18643 / organism=Chromera_velia_CCMP2878 / gene_product=Glutamate 5-kinase, putative / transcript_product=Glutamate 5-kinase, putative / location=Cvel_scaffold1557:28218-32259(-) / protein_length=564 / sequence_SO=supercontig / SO=protein_coding / is_pseudo=false
MHRMQVTSPKGSDLERLINGSRSEPDVKPNLVVLKVGTSTLMNTETRTISLANLSRCIETVSQLKEAGNQVIIVTSGAVGFGCSKLKLKTRPKTVAGRQAAAAVGQSNLMRVWEDLCDLTGVQVAQLLITRADFVNKKRYLNFRSTVKELLHWGVVPIINENDSLVSEGVKFGDNDTLAAHVAVLLSANYLFLLTDVDCLYTSDPRKDPGARPIPFVDRLEDIYKVMDCGDGVGGSKWGTGGMKTKIVAAKIAVAGGVNVAVCNGSNPERVTKMLEWAAKNELPNANPESVLYDYDKDADIKEYAQTFQKGEDEEEPMTPLKTLEVDADAKYFVPPEESAEKLAVIAECPTKVEDLPFQGTIFRALEFSHLRDQRRWILSLPLGGRIWINVACAKSVVLTKKALTIVGVVKVEGDFHKDEAVSIHVMKGDAEEEDEDTSMMPEECEIARCIVQHAAGDVRRAVGLPPEEAAFILNSVSPVISTSTNIALTIEEQALTEKGESICGKSDNGAGHARSELGTTTSCSDSPSERRDRPGGLVLSGMRPANSFGGSSEDSNRGPVVDA